jgi:hypothetical protein
VLIKKPLLKTLNLAKMKLSDRFVVWNYLHWLFIFVYLFLQYNCLFIRSFFYNPFLITLLLLILFFLWMSLFQSFDVLILSTLSGLLCLYGELTSLNISGCKEIKYAWSNCFWFQWLFSLFVMILPHC